MGRVGRPTICTPELTEEICQVLRAGNFIEPACQYVGISTKSYSNWVNKGRDEIERREKGEEPDETKEPYVRFFQAVTRARAQAEVEAVARMRQLARGRLRNVEGVEVDVDQRVQLEAEKWFLERSFRERWGKTRIDVHHSGETQLVLQLQTPQVLGAVEAEAELTERAELELEAEEVEPKQLEAEDGDADQ